MYENRADAHVKIDSYRDAVEDLTKAIELLLANQTLLMNVAQFRSLYPEYKSTSDEMLSRKLWTLFYPNLKYEDFAARFLDSTKRWSIALLNDPYEKRGDAYLHLGRFRLAIADFRRIYSAMPDFASSLERWRSVGTTNDGDALSVDVKAAEPTENGLRLWLKSVSKSGSSEVELYEADCSRHSLRVSARVQYARGGEVTSRSDEEQPWQRPVPGTVGESLYDGACASQ
jgi:tetratricopeptide (TPR) repeat protein